LRLQGRRCSAKREVLGYLANPKLVSQGCGSLGLHYRAPAAAIAPACASGAASPNPTYFGKYRGHGADQVPACLLLRP
jgi:hypothetical protein